MRKVRIIADEKIPFLKGVLDEKADVIYLPGSGINVKTVKNADALIIRTRTHCNEELLKGSSVKFIATATIGFDHIDTEWCKVNNINWTNAPGCNSSSVQQYMVSAVLSLFHKFRLNPSELTLGVIGVGNVGTKVSIAAETLGMKVLLNDPPRERSENNNLFCNIEEIIKKANIISFHVPLNKEGMDKTFHMAGKSFFSKLEKPVILFNTSRGEVIDGEALKKAIQENKIKASVIDVWENEPDIDEELLHLVTFGTPHIAGYSTDGKINGTVMSVRALSKFFNLGMDKWYPAEIPAPQNNVILCDSTGMDEMELLRFVYLQTYNIIEDDRKLRRDPAKFEFLRGNYPFRREPLAYNVKLINNTHNNISDKLGKLGFTVQPEKPFC